MHCAIFLLSALASHAAAVESTSDIVSAPGISSTALSVVPSATDLSSSFTSTSSSKSLPAGEQTGSAQANSTSSKGAAPTMNAGQAGGVAAIAIGFAAWLV